MTPSTPCPRLRTIPATTGSSPAPGLHMDAPNWRASINFESSKSTANTRHPWARNSCTVSKPINPAPITTNASPKVGWAKRMPCRPILATTTKDADSSSTLSGIRAQRFLETFTTSACGPLETTRSPGTKPSTPAPTSATNPTLQYPSGNGCASLDWTASIVAIKPSV
ncbi:hypothetical protein D9M72_379510 [compost metagenome]